MNRLLTRRDFLKTSLLGVGGIVLRPWSNWGQLAAQWPDAERMGRVCVGRVDLRARPSAQSQSVGVYYEDQIVVWLREVLGEAPGMTLGRCWIETPEGYLYAPSVQPVFNRPNQPLLTLPQSGLGQGMWVEVTVPYADLYLDNPPARSPWLQESEHPRLYYSQIMWVDDVATNSQGQVLYRVNEQYGTYGDVFWSSAEAFRPLTEEELAPISPGVPDKRIDVDINHQTLSCFEGGREVYHCRISSGAKFDAYGEIVEEWATPVGSFFIWRKLLSIHMAGGTVSGGYDLPGIAWTCLFNGDGVAIHSTFWHNDYGTPRSHGCVNASPEDAKWIFRWTEPHVAYDPGDKTINEMFVSTNVNVIEG